MLLDTAVAEIVEGTGQDSDGRTAASFMVARTAVCKQATHQLSPVVPLSIPGSVLEVCWVLLVDEKCLFGLTACCIAATHLRQMTALHCAALCCLQTCGCLWACRWHLPIISSLDSSLQDLRCRLTPCPCRESGATCLTTASAGSARAAAARRGLCRRHRAAQRGAWCYDFGRRFSWLSRYAKRRARGQTPTELLGSAFPLSRCRAVLCCRWRTRPRRCWRSGC